jgi:hypothetical protein
VKREPNTQQDCLYEEDRDYPNGKLQRYSGPDGTRTYTYDVRGLVETLAVTLSDGGTET